MVAAQEWPAQGLAGKEPLVRIVARLEHQYSAAGKLPRCAAKE
jgi:hypothetical protein